MRVFFVRYGPSLASLALFTSIEKAHAFAGTKPKSEVYELRNADLVRVTEE